MKKEVKKSFFATANSLDAIKLNPKDGAYVFVFNPGQDFYCAEWESETAYFEEIDLDGHGHSNRTGFSQTFTCPEHLIGVVKDSCTLVCVHLLTDGTGVLQGVDYSSIDGRLDDYCFFKSCKFRDNAINSVTRKSALEFDIKKSNIVTYKQINLTFE